MIIKKAKNTYILPSNFIPSGNKTFDVSSKTGQPFDYSNNNIILTPANELTAITDRYGNKFQAVEYNGVDDVVTTNTNASISSVLFWVNPYINNRDLIEIAAGIKISLNASNEIVTTGLTNVTTKVNLKYTNVVQLNSFQLVYIEFDEVTALNSKIGFSTTYFSGVFEDIIFYNYKISGEEQKAEFKDYQGKNNLFLTTTGGTVGITTVNTETQSVTWGEGSKENLVDNVESTKVYPSLPVRNYQIKLDNWSTTSLVYASNSKLIGNIPESFYTAINLNYIRIDRNDFSGGLSEKLGDLTSLTQLVANNSGLSGLIPSSVGNLSVLFNFFVSGCSFSGIIPSSFQLLTNLTSVGFHFNNFTGAELDAFIVNEWNIRAIRGSKSCNLAIQGNASGITEVDRIIGEGIYKYAIVNVNTASNWVEIAGDKTLDYPINSKFEIKGSTGNDAIGLIVTAVSFDGVNTRITTSSIPSAIDDGFVSDGLGIGGNGRGCNVTYTAA